MKIAIIGGGASGLWAANQIKRLNKDIQVIIYEKTDKTGRKILSSGNGRGNLSNTHIAPQFYNHPDFVTPILSFFSSVDFSFACRSLGVLLKTDEMGRIYPYGDSALVFLDALKLSNLHLGVIEKVLTPVYQIQALEDRFLVNGHDEFDIVILATGSQAGVPAKFQGKESELMLSSLDHQTVQTIPTLASIGVTETLKMISGQRLEVRASLLIDGKVILAREGEVLFREKALSGIVIFELSSHLAWHTRKHPSSQAIIRLDLMPKMSLEDVTEMLNHRPEHLFRSFDHLLTGIFHPSINTYLVYKTNDINTLANKVKQLDFHVDGAYLPDNNQVMNGGIHLRDVDNTSLESEIHPKLYFIGEALDVDGECGGFNLHFAWASASYVAQAIAKKHLV